MPRAEKGFTSTPKLQVQVGKPCAMQPPEVLPATLRTLGQLNTSMDRRGNQGAGPTSIHVPPPQYKHQPNTSDPKSPFLSPSRMPCNLPCLNKGQHCPQASNLATDTLFLSHPHRIQRFILQNQSRSQPLVASLTNPTLSFSLIHMTAAVSWSDSSFHLQALPHATVYTIPLKWRLKQV